MTSRIRSATRLTLILALVAPASLIAQNPADPTMRPRPAQVPARSAPPPAVPANPNEVVRSRSNAGGRPIAAPFAWARPSTSC